MTPITPDLSWLWQFGVSAAAVGVVMGTVTHVFGTLVGLPLRWSERALGG